MSYDSELKKIKEELLESRCVIMHLLKEPYADIFRGSSDCANRDEARQWWADAIDQVIANTHDLLKASNYSPETAYCPLCGHGSTSLYQHGFVYPEGLKRHLEGAGNTTHCIVMKEIHGLMFSQWNDKFRWQEQQERGEKFKEEANRLQNETLYLVSPFEDPGLIDSGFFLEEPRHKEDMRWAEARIKGLKFTISKENNIKSYIRDHDFAVVYADPRTCKKITFRVYKKPFPKRRPSTRNNRHFLGEFELRDLWKRELKYKYESRVEAFENRK